MIAVPAGVLISSWIRLLAVAVLGLWLWPFYALPTPSGLDSGERRLMSGIWFLLIVAFGGSLLTAAHLFSWLSLLALAALPRALAFRRRHSPYQLSFFRRLAAFFLEELSYHAGWTGMIRRMLSVIPKSVSGWFSHSLYTWFLWLILLCAAAAVVFLQRTFPWTSLGTIPSSFFSGLRLLESARHGQLWAAGVFPPGLPALLTAWDLLSRVNLLVLGLLVGPWGALATLAAIVFVAGRLTGRLLSAVAAALFYAFFPHLLFSGVPLAAFGPALIGPPLAVLAFYFTRMSFSRGVPADRVTTAALLALAGLLGLTPWLDTAVAILAAAVPSLVTDSRDKTGPALWDLVVLLPAALLVAVIPLDLGVLAGHPLMPLITDKPATLPNAITVLILLAILWLALVIRAFSGEDWAFGDLVSVMAAVAATVTIPALARQGLLPAAALTVNWAPAAMALAVAILAGAAEQWLFADRGALGRRWLATGLAVGLTALGLWRSPSPVPTVAHPALADSLTQYIRLESILPRYRWLAVDTSSPLLGADQVAVYASAAWIHDARGQGGLLTLNGRPLAVPRVFLFIPRAGSAQKEPLASRELYRWYLAWKASGGSGVLYYHSRRLSIYELLPKKRG